MFNNIKISNPINQNIMVVDSVFDIKESPIQLIIPKRISELLKLESIVTREMCINDGEVIKVPYVGPIKLDYYDQVEFIGAYVYGDEVILNNLMFEKIVSLLENDLENIENNLPDSERELLKSLNTKLSKLLKK